MSVKSKVAAPRTTITAPSTVSTITPPTLGAGLLTSTTGVSTTLPLGNKKPTGFRLKLQQMVAGVQAVLADDSAIPSTGAATLTKAAMLSKLSVGLSDYAAIDNLANAAVLARKQLATDLPVLKAYFVQVREALQVFYGKSNPQLSQFGLVVAKAPPKQTPEQLMVANVRRSQTRGMRNTMGAKQKAAIQFQGDVAVTATPSTAASPAASPVATPSSVPASVTPAAPLSVEPALQIVKP